MIRTSRTFLVLLAASVGTFPPALPLHRAEAATGLPPSPVCEILRPNSNVNTLWSDYTYTKINDNVVNPAVPDYDYVNADSGDDFEEQIWGFTDPQGTNYSTVSAIYVHMYGYGGHASPLTLRLKVGGTWTSTQSIDPDDDWHEAVFTGSWSKNDLNSLELGLKTPNMTSSNDVMISAIYCEICGPMHTPTPTPTNTPTPTYTPSNTPTHTHTFTPTHTPTPLPTPAAIFQNRWDETYFESSDDEDVVSEGQPFWVYIQGVPNSPHYIVQRKKDAGSWETLSPTMSYTTEIVNKLYFRQSSSLPLGHYHYKVTSPGASSGDELTDEGTPQPGWIGGMLVATPVPTPGPPPCTWSVGVCSPIDHNHNSSWINADLMNGNTFLGQNGVNWCPGCSCSDYIDDLRGIKLYEIDPGSSVTIYMMCQDPDYIGPYSGGTGMACGGATNDSRHLGDNISWPAPLDIPGTYFLTGITVPQTPDSVPADHDCTGVPYHVDTVFPPAEGYVHFYRIDIWGDFPILQDRLNGASIPIHYRITEPVTLPGKDLCQPILDPTISIRIGHSAGGTWPPAVTLSTTGWEGTVTWDGKFGNGQEWDYSFGVSIGLINSEAYDILIESCVCGTYGWPLFESIIVDKCFVKIVPPPSPYYCPNETINLSARIHPSDSGTLTWSAPGGTPSSKTGSPSDLSFSTSFGTPGAYTITATWDPTGPEGPCSNDLDLYVIGVTSIDAEGAEEIPPDPTQGDQNMIHFVTPKEGSGQVKLTASLNLETTEILNQISWEGATQDPDDPLVAYVDKSSAGKKIVKIKFKTCVLQELRVWVVWSNNSGTAPLPTGNPYLPVGPWLSVDLGGYVGGYFFYTYVTPTQILTDTDRPDLIGAKDNSSLPPGGTDHCNRYLKNGADKKWDISRRMRIKHIVMQSYLSTECELTEITDYPAVCEIGNDDAWTTDPEDDDPYQSPSLNALTEPDNPRIRLPHSMGNLGDELEIRVEFEMFSRVELNSTWFCISDGFPWRVYYKLKKVNIDESVDGVDINGDNDMNDVVPGWKDNGSFQDLQNDSGW